MPAKKEETAPKKAERTYYNINIKGATLGDSYSIYLNDAFKKTFGGTITEENFTVSVPGEKVKMIVLKIKPQNGKAIEKDIPLVENSEILLKPSAEIKTDSGKKFLTNSIREMLATRREEIERQAGQSEPSLQQETPEESGEEKQVVNELAEQVEEKREQTNKKSFWDKLK